MNITVNKIKGNLNNKLLIEDLSSFMQGSPESYRKFFPVWLCSLCCCGRSC